MDLNNDLPNDEYAPYGAFFKTQKKNLTIGQLSNEPFKKPQFVNPIKIAKLKPLYSFQNVAITLQNARNRLDNIKTATFNKMLEDKVELSIENTRLQKQKEQLQALKATFKNSIFSFMVDDFTRLSADRIRKDLAENDDDYIRLNIKEASINQKIDAYNEMVRVNNESYTNLQEATNNLNTVMRQFIEEEVAEQQTDEEAVELEEMVRNADELSSSINRERITEEININRIDGEDVENINEVLDNIINEIENAQEEELAEGERMIEQITQVEEAREQVEGSRERRRGRRLGETKDILAYNRYVKEQNERERAFQDLNRLQQKQIDDKRTFRSVIRRLYKHLEIGKEEDVDVIGDIIKGKTLQEGSIELIANWAASILQGEEYDLGDYLLGKEIIKQPINIKNRVGVKKTKQEFLGY